MDVPYRCPKCRDGATFSTFSDLKQHLSQQHAYVPSPRKRVQVFNGKKGVVDSGRDPLLEAFHDENIRLEKQLQDARDAEMNNKLKRYGKDGEGRFHNDIMKSVGAEFVKPSMVSFQDGHVRNMLNTQVSMTQTSSTNQVLMPVVMPSHLPESEEVMSNVEKAAETRCSEQRRVIEKLKSDLTDKEKDLKNSEEELNRLRREQNQLIESAEILSRKTNEETKKLSDELEAKEFQLHSINSKLAKLRENGLEGWAAHLKRQPSWKSEKDAKNLMMERKRREMMEKLRAANGLEDEDYDSRINDGTPVTRNNSMEQEDQLDVLSQELRKIQREAVHRMQEKDKELVRAKKRSEKLEKDRLVLLHEMENLLTKANNDNEKLKMDLKSKDDELQEFNSNLEEAKKDQSKLVGETFEIYRQADKNIAKLKEMVTLKEFQLQAANEKLNQFQVANEQLIAESESIAIHADEKGNIMESMLQDHENNLQQMERELNETKYEKEKLKEETETLKQEVEERSRSLEELRQEVADKENELQKTNDDLKTLQTFLQTTAAKESVARKELEKFIMELIERASKAEKELRALKRHVRAASEESQSLQSTHIPASLHQTLTEPVIHTTTAQIHPESQQQVQKVPRSKSDPQPKKRTKQTKLSFGSKKKEKVTPEVVINAEQIQNTNQDASVAEKQPIQKKQRQKNKIAVSLQTAVDQQSVANPMDPKISSMKSESNPVTDVADKAKVQEIPINAQTSDKIVDKNSTRGHIQENSLHSPEEFSGGIDEPKAEQHKQRVHDTARKVQTEIVKEKVLTDMAIQTDVETVKEDDQVQTPQINIQDFETSEATKETSEFPQQQNDIPEQKTFNDSECPVHCRSRADVPPAKPPRLGQLCNECLHVSGLDSVPVPIYSSTPKKSPGTTEGLCRHCDQRIQDYSVLRSPQEMNLESARAAVLARIIADEEAMRNLQDSRMVTDLSGMRTTGRSYSGFAERFDRIRDPAALRYSDSSSYSQSLRDRGFRRQEALLQQRASLLNQTPRKPSHARPRSSRRREETDAGAASSARTRDDRKVANSRDKVLSDRIEKLESILSKERTQSNKKLEKVLNEIVDDSNRISSKEGIQKLRESIKPRLNLNRVNNSNPSAPFNQHSSHGEGNTYSISPQSSDNYVGLPSNKRQVPYQGHKNESTSYSTYRSSEPDLVIKNQFYGVEGPPRRYERARNVLQYDAQNHDPMSPPLGSLEQSETEYRHARERLANRQRYYEAQVEPPLYQMSSVYPPSRQSLAYGQHYPEFNHLTYQNREYPQARPWASSGRHPESNHLHSGTSPQYFEHFHRRSQPLPLRDDHYRLQSRPGAPYSSGQRARLYQMQSMNTSLGGMDSIDVPTDSEGVIGGGDLSMDENGILWDEEAVDTSDDLESFHLNPTGSDTAEDLDSSLILSDSGSPGLATGPSPIKKVEEKDGSDVSSYCALPKTSQDARKTPVAKPRKGKGHNKLKSDNGGMVSEIVSVRDKMMKYLDEDDLKRNSGLSAERQSKEGELNNSPSASQSRPAILSTSSPNKINNKLNSEGVGDSEDSSSSYSPIQLSKTKKDMVGKLNVVGKVRDDNEVLEEIIQPQQKKASNSLEMEISRKLNSLSSSSDSLDQIPKRKQNPSRLPGHGSTSSNKDIPDGSQQMVHAEVHKELVLPVVSESNKGNDVQGESFDNRDSVLGTSIASDQAEEEELNREELNREERNQGELNQGEQNQEEELNQGEAGNEVPVMSSSCDSLDDLAKYDNVPLKKAQRLRPSFADEATSDDDGSKRLQVNQGAAPGYREESTDFDFESDLERFRSPLTKASYKGRPKRNKVLTHKKAKSGRRLSIPRVNNDESSDNASDASRLNQKRHEAAKRRRVALFCVFNYLDTRNLGQMALVCREWRHVCRHPELWRKVELRNERISSSFLVTISKWCPRLQHLTLEGLRGREKQPEENEEEYQQSLRCSLEGGLEELLKCCQDNLTSLTIRDCHTLLSNKCLWLVSCYGRLLDSLQFVSDSDPISAEVLWAIGGGCPGITRLIIPPLFPCQKPKCFTNKCLVLIGKFYPELRELGVGGEEIDIGGLLPLVQTCQRLQYLELDHVSEITSDEATAVCRAGLKNLSVLVLKSTQVTPDAIKQIYKSCRHLKRIRVELNFHDFFDDVSEEKNREEYEKRIKKLQDLRRQPGLASVLRIETALLDHDE